jgi:hypothetical protein
VTGLAVFEEVIGASGAAARIEAMLPAGARARRLAVRTLLLGMMPALADGRPARLARVRQALAGLPEGEQRRPGVLADREGGPHLLTYRQAEYTFNLVTGAPGKDQPDGLPSPGLQAACDDLLEASIPDQFHDVSASLAVDWTGLETFSRPPPRGTSGCAGPEASRGHRKNSLRREEDELFFGYYLSDAVTVPDEQGQPVPELARRMTASACRRDPVPAFTPVLTALPAAGIPLGDVLAGSGYSHRVPRNWASPLRQAGAQLVQGLHPLRPQGHPPGRRHRQREPPLPPDAPGAARARPAVPCRRPRAGRAAPRADRRGRPLQARPPHRRRRRRLPPRRLPRRHGQGPLPAAPRLDEP